MNLVIDLKKRSNYLSFLTRSRHDHLLRLLAVALAWLRLTRLIQIVVGHGLDVDVQVLVPVEGRVQVVAQLVATPQILILFSGDAEVVVVEGQEVAAILGLFL